MFLPLLALAGVIGLIWSLSKENEGEFSPDENAPEPTDPSEVSDDMVVTGYVKGVPRNILVAPIGGNFYLRVDAAQAFKKMRAQCLADTGQDLSVSTAFRSMEHQTRLYNELGPDVAAKPGYSNHQNGIALDLNGLNPAKPNYNKRIDDWLSNNSERFGWKRSGLTFAHVEQWHLDYA